MKKYNGLMALVLSFLLVFSTAKATTWYVHPDSTLNSIQAGIDSCSTGDTVLVGPGTYIENINFNGMAIRVMSEYDPGVTIIDGSNPPYFYMGSVVLFASGEDSNSVLEGFTITNGSGTFFSGLGTLGGGVFCGGSSPIIRGNIISGNTATWGGGGIGLGNSSAIIDSNTINYNEADTVAGGILVATDAHPRIFNNDISSNIAQWGGGLYVVDFSNPQITNNDIRNNTAFQYGGGLGIAWQAAPTVEDNNIEYNAAHAGAGGILCGTESQPVIKNCTIQYDTAYTAGLGGGIHVYMNSSPTIEKCTISYNSDVGVSCQNCTTSIDSSTISYNTLHGIRCYNMAYAVINYCNIHGNAGYGVLNEYPAITINAEFNWWGDASGPYHPTTNPGGLGDSVSDYVDFDPWLDAPIGIYEYKPTPILTYELKNKPNPFKNRTIIYYSLTKSGIISLKVYDQTGRLVKILENGIKRAGNYTVSWDGCNNANQKVPAGVYFAILKSGDFTSIKKIILVR
jgi:parallel beta-helix repeat protein